VTVPGPVAGRTSVRRAAPGKVLAVALAAALMAPACGAAQDNARPVCGYGDPTLLMAEAVPSATLVPCVRSLPVGWHFHGFEAERGNAGFALDSEQAGTQALVVSVAPSCRPEGSPASSDERGTQLFRRGANPSAGYAATWWYRYAGGCTIYRIELPSGPVANLIGQIRSGLSFTRRAELDRASRAHVGVGLGPP